LKIDLAASAMEMCDEPVMVSSRLLGLARGLPSPAAMHATACGRWKALSRWWSPAAQLLPASKLLGNGHQFEQVAVGGAKINAASTAPIVQLAIVGAPGGATIAETGLFHLRKNAVEFDIRNVKGVVVAFEVAVIIEKERQSIIDLDWCEMLAGPWVCEAKQLREHSRCSFLVPRRHDGVVECDGHLDISSCGSLLRTLRLAGREAAP